MDFVASSFIATTEAIMLRLAIPIRDTWRGLDGDNLDDFHANGEQHNGPRLFSISFSASQRQTESKAKKYSIPGFASLAWDRFHVCVPERLRDESHVLMHETTHFLQHLTSGEDKTYISFDGTNYESYFAQCCELEAHTVQLFYVAMQLPAHIVAASLNPEHLVHQIETTSRNSSSILPILIQCRKLSIV